MHSILEIARLTFTEAVQGRIYYGVLIFLVLILATASALASVTMGRTELMVLDIGLAGVSLLGNLMAIVLTIQSMQFEKENRTLYVLLTRLPYRWQYIVGKFVGIAVVLAIQVLGMCALLALFVFMLGPAHVGSFVQACVATLVEVCLVAAIALIFAQASSLFLGILYTLSIDVVGRFTSVIRQFGEQSDSWLVQGLTQIAYYILPNLEAVNLRDQAGYIPAYEAARLTSVLTYGVIEAAVLVCLAALIFHQRDLS